MPNIVLILGSAPDVVRSRDWPRGIFTSIVAINNAWAVRQDWNYLVHADDFPQPRLPAHDMSGVGSIITSEEFVPAQNTFGGFVYAGGTMAFTAAYWAIHRLRPDILAFAGCDMVYRQNSPTHFYGSGTADPLRDDVTLRSLEAKSARLFVKALQTGTICLNLSELPESRLVIPRASLSFLGRLTQPRIEAVRTMLAAAVDQRKSAQAAALETSLGYLVESGRYWERVADFDEAKLAQIDRHWLSAVERLPASVVPNQGCWRQAGVRVAA